ncbi:hypothetical protein GCM10023176_60110 [Micromonospora coerulea]|uniref:Uncharacterized protein n=1 Tax=Micromonospora coerulea TaxID=47856 RepID=A0ABP8T551_9ACTN
MKQQQPYRYCVFCGSALVSASCPRCGPARPSSVPHGSPPAPVPVAPRLRTPADTRRIWPAVLITAIVGLVLLCTATVRLVPRFIGPEAAVRAYFDALADRDATRARGLLAEGSAIGQRGPIAGVDERADLSLLTDATLHHAGYTPPRNLTVGRTIWTGTSATVEASYDFGGPPITITLPLVNERGLRGLPSWRITDGLLELRLESVVTGRLVVAGATLPMTTTRSMVAFPGAYRVALPEHPLYRAEPAIAFANGASASLSPVEVRENVRRDVEQQVRAHVDGCARRIELAPSGCPFVASSSVPVKILSWTIVRYPELSFTVVADGGVSVTSPGQGVAAATVIRTSGAGASWQETVSFDISGTVRVVDGKAVLSNGR